MKIAARFVIALALAFGATLTGTMGPAAAARQNAQGASTDTTQGAGSHGQTVTQLPDGRVLVVGGETNGVPVATARIIDRVTGAMTQIALPVPRAHHTATVLADGSVLIAGGTGANGQPVSIPDVFDPSTGAFTPISIAGATARTGASATLLTDGRVLIVGGQDGAGQVPGAEVWDLAHNTATTLASVGATPRSDHTATLMPDGRVLVANGDDASGHARSDADLVDPSTGTFTAAAPLPSADLSQPIVVATTPADGAHDVPEDVRIAVRFSKALSITTIAQAMALSNQDGPLPVSVVPAEHGRLAFVTSSVTLAPDTQYSLLIDGATDDRGVAVAPSTVSFTTRADDKTSNSDVIDTEPWVPNAADAKNGWPTNRPQSPWQALKPLMAPDGVTAIAGQVLRLDGRPLAHVTLEVSGQDTRTDGTGRFLLLLPGMASGHRELGIDGRTANRPNRTYGTFEYGLDVVAGRTTVLPFTIWMPLIDTAHQVTIPSPTTRDTVVTTPYIPGLELHLPAGTVIKDDDGHVVRTVSISPIPVDRPPFPLPTNSDVPIYFTIQPGGAYITGDWADPTRGAWLVYPNYRHEFPGKRIQFYQYDPEKIGWHVYGVGTVTPNGTQVTPDPTTRLWAFTGAMINSGPAPPADGAPPGDCPSCANGGDPVNLTTGLFSLDQTDLALPDTLPIAVTRTYRSRDPEVRPFGPGTTDPYAMFLWSAHQYTEADLVLPDGAKIHYVRTSGGVSFADAIFQHVETDTTSATPTAFYKSTIVWNGNGWNLTLLDGTVYVFGENAPLQAIRDKFGNTITIAHAAGQAGNVTQVTSPHGRWIAFTYGEDANCATCISHITDNIGRTVHYAYDTSGNLWKVTDTLGHVTEYTYDSNHNMLTVKNRNGVVYVTNEYTTAADAPTPVGWVKTGRTRTRACTTSRTPSPTARVPRPMSRIREGSSGV
jgi:YD repeat-containing protein